MSPTEPLHLEAIPSASPAICGDGVDMCVLTSYEGLQLDGEPDLIVELIDLYREDAPRRVASMRASLVQRNWVSVRSSAHSLRGSSGHLGATQLAVICDEIEKAESEDMFKRIETLLSRLELELKQVLCIFVAERRRRVQ